MKPKTPTITIPYLTIFISTLPKRPTFSLYTFSASLSPQTEHPLHLNLHPCVLYTYPCHFPCLCLYAAPMPSLAPYPNSQQSLSPFLRLQHPAFPLPQLDIFFKANLSLVSSPAVLSIKGGGISQRRVVFQFSRDFSQVPQRGVGCSWTASEEVESAASEHNLT